MKCSATPCGQDATWRAQAVRNSAAVDDDHALCEGHARSLWDSYLADRRKGVGAEYRVPGAACVELELIMFSFSRPSTRVLLREVEGTRLMFFPIGFERGSELLWAIHDYPYNALTLHVALKRLVEYVGGTLAHVLLDWLSPDGRLEAYAVIRHQMEVIKLQIHPSDGLVLAMMTQVPIVVTDEAFSRVAEQNRGAEAW